jgi:hypothetical protein
MKAIDRLFTKIINSTTQFIIPVFQRDKGLKSYGIFPALLPADVVASMYGDGEHVSFASVRDGAQVFLEALCETVSR